MSKIVKKSIVKLAIISKKWYYKYIVHLKRRKFYAEL